MNGIWYFDPDYEKEYYTTLELFGYSFEMVTFDEGKICKRIHGSHNKAIEISYQVVSSNGAYVTLETDYSSNSYIRMSMSDFGRLKTHYSKINSPFLATRENFDNKVIEKLPELLNDIELVQMAKNFISDTSQVIYVDPCNLIGVECLIENSTYFGRSLLLSDELQRSSVSRTEELTKGYITKLFFHVKNENILIPFMEDGFWQFAKLVDDRFELNNEEQAYFLTYLFLYRNVVDYFNTFANQAEETGELST